MSNACKACAYFESKPETTQTGGLCHFNPPQTSADMEALWPVVKADDWCARFNEA